MNQSNNAQMSNIEKKILNELQKNCRLNLDEIGKKCGCSRYRVGRIMKKLENNGSIIGYSAIINPNKINLRYYLLLIKRSSIPVDDITLNRLPVNEISDLLPEGVTNIKLEDTLYLHGDFDWITTFTSNDISYAKEYANQILKVFHKYVDHITLLETVTPIRIKGLQISRSKQVPEIL
jgi:Lrp/AsnC family leucine-responsive transcriptional regulator